MFYNNNHDPQSKFQSADKNTMTFYNLIKKLKANLVESQKLQMFYHNKNVKKRLYKLGESVWLSWKQIKTKQNFILEHKYLGFFKILEAVKKQIYRLKLFSKWCIYPIFYVLFLEKVIIKKEAVNQKITN